MTEESTWAKTQEAFNEWRKEQIDRRRDAILESVAGGTLFGQTINLERPEEVLVAAYYFGYTDGQDSV